MLRIVGTASDMTISRLFMHHAIVLGCRLRLFVHRCPVPGYIRISDSSIIYQIIGARDQASGRLIPLSSQELFEFQAVRLSVLQQQ
jgi:hypothetical protein